MKIQQRHTLFSKHEDVVLKQDVIVRQRNGKIRQSIRFDEITKVQLVFDGFSQAHEKEVYRCIVQAGRKKLVFTNSLFHDPQPEMDGKYHKMVEGLHRKLDPYANRIQFWQGSNLFHFCAWLILIFGVLILLAFPAMIIHGIATGRDITELLRKLWVFALMPMALGGVAIPLLKRGRRKGYTVAELPGEFLPA